MTGTRWTATATATARRAAAVVLLAVLLGGLLGVVLAAGADPGARNAPGAHAVKVLAGKAVAASPLRGDDGGAGWPTTAPPVLLLLAAAGLVALSVAAAARRTRFRNRVAIASRAPPVRPVYAR